MVLVYVVSHPEVRIEPETPVTAWGLSAAGRVRLQRLLVLPWVLEAKFVASSTERKALETAQAVAAAAGRAVHEDDELGENDRSATGFLPPDDFEALADAFFADPDTSTHGWETALHAQERIVRAVDRVIDRARVSGAVGDSDTVVISTHGGVGTLLHCALREVPISRTHDQQGQGSYYCFDTETRRVPHGWRRI